MKKILLFACLVALFACQDKPQPEPAVVQVQEVNVRDSALLSLNDIMKIYRHAYMAAVAHNYDGGTLEQRWSVDSSYFVPKVQPLLIK